MIPPIKPESVHQTVPRVMHQMWMGPAAPPLVQENWEIWDDALGGDWRVERWDDQRVQGHPLLGPMTEDLRASGVSWRAVTDVLRLWILSIHGGVYMDCDAYPAGPIDSLAGGTAWVGQRPGRLSWSLCNGFFGAPAGHPYLSEVLHLADTQRQRGVVIDHFFAGPVTFWRAYRNLPAQQRPTLRRDATSQVGGHLTDVLVSGAAYDRQLAAEQNPGNTVIHP